MFFLIAPLRHSSRTREANKSIVGSVPKRMPGVPVFIGFFSPATSESVDSESQKSNEHLISLRDYDFVGEDQRLAALLAERMAVLQAPLNLSGLEGGGPAPEPAGPWPRDPGPFRPKPDYLQSNVRLPHQVNVSMDYAEYFNTSDWLLEVNASLLALIPKPGGASVPGPGGPPAPGYGRAPAPGYGRAPASGTGWAPAPGPGRDGRRQRYIDPSHLDYNNKILDIMKQCIYTTQRKIIELDPLVNKYERDPRFRMAFIFNRLDEWKHDMRTVLYSTMKYRYYPRRVKRVIWYYEHMLRLNIDITYSVEHLVHLHSGYMTNMENIMPLGQRFQIQSMRKEQRKLKKMKALGLTTTPAGFVGLPS